MRASAAGPLGPAAPPVFPPEVDRSGAADELAIAAPAAVGTPAPLEAVPPPSSAMPGSGDGESVGATSFLVATNGIIVQTVQKGHSRVLVGADATGT